MFYQISRPWAYIMIKGKEKWVFDFLLPSILSIIVTAAAILSKGSVNYFGPGGIISSFTSFIQSLPGFFIAALSVVATFQKKEMDFFLAPPTPEIAIRIDGRIGLVRLTRRRFLGLLFSFLTAQSIIITGLGIFLSSFSGYATSLISIDLRIYMFSFAILLYMYLVFQMLIVTFWGLYYLSERMYQGEMPTNSD